uniref:PA151R n=1 Tax=African swine fever virus TaxID=10497 RepID=A0A6G7KU87_ASF
MWCLPVVQYCFYYRILLCQKFHTWAMVIYILPLLPIMFCKAKKILQEQHPRTLLQCFIFGLYKILKILRFGVVCRALKFILQMFYIIRIIFMYVYKIFGMFQPQSVLVSLLFVPFGVLYAHPFTHLPTLCHPIYSN